FLVAAAKQPRHPEIPATERAIGRALLKRRVEAQHRLELLLDRLAVLQALPQSVRLGQGAHVGGEPEMTFRTIRLRGDCLARGVDAGLVEGAPLALLGVPAEPVRP